MLQPQDSPLRHMTARNVIGPWVTRMMTAMGRAMGETG